MNEGHLDTYASWPEHNKDISHHEFQQRARHICELVPNLLGIKSDNGVFPSDGLKYCFRVEAHSVARDVVVGYQQDVVAPRTVWYEFETRFKGMFPDGIPSEPYITRYRLLQEEDDVIFTADVAPGESEGEEKWTKMSYDDLSELRVALRHVAGMLKRPRLPGE